MIECPHSETRNILTRIERKHEVWKEYCTVCLHYVKTTRRELPPEKVKEPEED